jgi:hypothetical protein
MTMRVKIGIDFDNTIVCYDAVFHRLAVQNGLIPAETPARKRAVRDRLRQAGIEHLWTMLQGQVYGSCTLAAEPFPGVVDFFQYCRDEEIDVCIISHKTRFAKRGIKYDLHQAALNWLSHYRFFDQNLIELHNVHFEPHRGGKLRRIAAAQCDYFVDDLLELLEAPGFPRATNRLLFDPGGDAAASDIKRFSSWYEAKDFLHASASI